MKGPPFRKVTPGERVASLSPVDWNGAMAAAAANANPRPGTQGGGAGGGVGDPAVVTVVNSTGGDVDRFAILSIGSVTILPDDDVDTFAERVLFSASAPTPEEDGRFGISVEPIANDEAGLVVVAGVCQVKIDVKDDAHRFARVVDGETGHLESTDIPSGTVILWRAGTEAEDDEDEDTDIRWAVVRLGNPGGVTLYNDGEENPAVGPVTFVNIPASAGGAIKWQASTVAGAAGADLVFEDADDYTVLQQLNGNQIFDEVRGI